jgi:hypothetical protein
MGMSFDQMLSAVERTAALSAPGLLVLALVALIRGWVVTGRQLKEIVAMLIKQLASMEADRDFWKQQYVDQTNLLKQQLGVN